MRTSIRTAASLALVTGMLAACSTAPGAASVPASSPSSALPCEPGSLQTKTPGTFTIGTDNPAFPPYFEAREGGNTEPWDSSQGDPTTGKGFESAFGYALAEQLGFAADKVTWIVVPFLNSFSPGPKDFDVDINQVAFTEERAEGADLSEGYYFGNQAVVVPEDGKLASATTITELKAAKLGAQVGTTSFRAIEDVIKPTQAASAYDTNDLAIEALEVGQLDGIVVDLPTGFFITFVQTEGNKVLGQIGEDAGAEPEHFSAVLEKDSPLTDCVNAAILALREDGTIDTLIDTYLSDNTVPEFKP